MRYLFPDPAIPTARFSDLDPINDCSVLHSVLQKSMTDDLTFLDTAEDKYERCLDAILSNPSGPIRKEIRKIINKRDRLGNTALHYATQVSYFYRDLCIEKTLGVQSRSRLHIDSKC